MVRYVDSTESIPLPVALWLVDSEYTGDPNHVSVTTLIKPLKQIIMAYRAPKDTPKEPIELSRLFKAQVGTSLHKSLEMIWVSGKYKTNMKILGYDQETIDSIVVNPDPYLVTEDQIPVYTELRTDKEIKGVTISGELDLVFDGVISDYKSSAVFKYTKASDDKKHILQESIYRWLNPTIITQSKGAINCLLLDWTAKGKAASTANRKYPSAPTPQVLHELMSIEDTEKWIIQRLDDINKYMSADEDDIPICTNEDLWQDEPIYKYYKNPEKKARSQGNFKTFVEARAKKQKCGDVGVIDIVHGEAKACNYCPACDYCKQAQSLRDAGILK